MADIFNSSGHAFVKKDRETLCRIKGLDASLLVLKMTGQDSPNVQIDFAMSADTYLLDFGEKLSPITVAGIAPYTKGCKGAADLKSQINKLYEDHKLGKKPVDVTIGSDTYSAYITGKSTSVSAEQPELLNYSFSFLGYKQGGKSSGSNEKKNEKKKPASKPRHITLIVHGNHASATGKKAAGTTLHSAASVASSPVNSAAAILSRHA